MKSLSCAFAIAMVFSTAAMQISAQQPALSGRVAAGTRPLSSVIHGNALTSTNSELPNAVVRLRDARYGGIIATQTTDAVGLFTFAGLEPGSYIVEIVDSGRTVLAASEVININAGEAASAIVKLPFRIPPFAGVLGHSTATAVVVASEAAAAAVLAVATVGVEQCQKPQG